MPTAPPAFEATGRPVTPKKEYKGVTVTAIEFTMILGRQSQESESI